MILQHGHALLAQRVCHLPPERRKVPKHTRSCRGACLSALERRWNKIHETVAEQSCTTFLAAFQSLLCQDAAPGKVAHESLMTSILFNTSNWATALSSCNTQAKCHDPRGSEDLTEGGRLTGNRRPHDPQGRVHHPSSDSVTKTWGGCCCSAENRASFDTCPLCYKAVWGALANIKSFIAFSIGTPKPWFSLLPVSHLHALKKFTLCYSTAFYFSIFMLCCLCFPAPFPQRNIFKEQLWMHNWKLKYTKPTYRDNAIISHNIIRSRGLTF